MLPTSVIYYIYKFCNNNQTFVLFSLEIKTNKSYIHKGDMVNFYETDILHRSRYKRDLALL